MKRIRQTVKQIMRDTRPSVLGTVGYEYLSGQRDIRNVKQDADLHMSFTDPLGGMIYIFRDRSSIAVGPNDGPLKGGAA